MKYNITLKDYISAGMTKWSMNLHDKQQVWSKGTQSLSREFPVGIAFVGDDLVGGHCKMDRHIYSRLKVLQYCVLYIPMYVWFYIKDDTWHSVCAIKVKLT